VVARLEPSVLADALKTAIEVEPRYRQRNERALTHTEKSGICMALLNETAWGWNGFLHNN
jgi:hypothetical protein